MGLGIQINCLSTDIFRMFIFEIDIAKFSGSFVLG